MKSVSYTHLDVYKRQHTGRALFFCISDRQDCHVCIYGDCGNTFPNGGGKAPERGEYGETFLESNVVWRGHGRCV